MEIIAIVGRPNVGKSSLFNRIAGKKKTIVNEKSGVTRDRIYEQVNFGDKSAILIDTGGFELSKKDIIKELILKQTDAAIEEADKIIAIFDAKTGFMPDDRELVKKLRKSKKRVFYAVNKVDSKLSSDNIAEFYSLGVDKFYEISAMQGTGVADLKIEIASFIKEISDKEKIIEESETAIAIVGRPNVGKSSIVNKMLKFERVMVNDKPGTTRDSVDTYFTFKNQRYVLIDTAGMRRRSKIDDTLEAASVISALKSVERADFVILVVDSSKEIATQDLRISNHALSRGKALLIVVNKIDELEDYKKINYREFEENIRNSYPSLSFCPFIFTSAIKNENIEKIMNEVVKVKKYYVKNIPTKVLNQFLKTSKINDTIKFVKNKRGVRGKIKYITQTHVAPPKFLVFCNNPSFIKNRYGKFLINLLRKEFIFSGVPVKTVFRKE